MNKMKYKWHTIMHDVTRNTKRRRRTGGDIVEGEDTG
jgi:hypothetical protein